MQQIEDSDKIIMTWVIQRMNIFQMKALNDQEQKELKLLNYYFIMQQLEQKNRDQEDQQRSISIIRTVKKNNFSIQMSQFGDSSGISRSTISPDKKYLATAGGSGECKLWDIETATLKSSLLVHLTK
ncbi:unnamed protein product [Paramecium sonneborni]|uniref:Uncharacterized protein n=1 Tax=Paramecium sonneborni TaxID=65129 RepID=A0A8S1QDX1_9CILI|nr:unnamed protein product [Paramecium sonneborni]